MKILLHTDDLLKDLSPEVATADSDRIKQKLEAYYGSAGMVPVVSVDGDVVTVELDLEQEEAFGRDYDRASNLAQSGKYSEARGLLESLIERHPAISDLHRMYAQVLFEGGDGEAAVDPLIDALRWNRRTSTPSS